MKLLILDRDGTLTTPASGGEFRQHPRDLMLLPGVREKIQEGVKDGWTIAIASNQGGCEAINPATGKPYQTREWAIQEMLSTFELLPEIEYALIAPSFETNGYGEAIEIDCSEGGQYVKHLTNGALRFRKPNPGMIEAIWRRHPIGNQLHSRDDWEEILIVGDRPEDEGAAKAAGVKFVWAHDWRVGWTKKIGF